MHELTVRIEKLRITLAVLVIAFAFHTNVAGETIRITNGEWQPFMSERAPHYGVGSHIVSEAFALVGVEVEYGFFPWKRCYELAKRGDWNGTIGWAYTEERAQFFYFTDNIFTIDWAVFHMKGTRVDWRTISDLRTLRLGATLEYSYGAAFDEAVEAGVLRPDWVATDELNLKKLLKGRIDAFVGELMVTYTQIHDNFTAEDAARFTHHPKYLQSRRTHLLLSRAVPRNARLAELFDAGLKRLKETGRYAAIIANGKAGEYATAR